MALPAKTPVARSRTLSSTTAAAPNSRNALAATMTRSNSRSRLKPVICRIGRQITCLGQTECRQGFAGNGVAAAGPFQYARALSRENQDVLTRQSIVRPGERKPLSLDLHPRLGNRHLVLGPDGHARIFFSVLEQHEPPAGLQRCPYCLKHLLGLRQLVVDVDHQYKINGR